jgi:hypothetical protein
MDSNNDCVGGRTRGNLPLKRGRFREERGHAHFPTLRLSKLAATLRFEAFQRRVQCQRSVSRGREGGHAPAQVIGSIDFIETECGIALLENSGATQVAEFIR